MTKATLAALLVTVLTVLTVVGSVVGVLTPSPATAAAPPQARAQAAPYEVEPFRLQASDNARLKHAWKAWTARAGHRRYTTVVSVGCFCQPRRAVVTRVRAGTVTSVTHEGRTTELKRHGYDVPGLYLTLREAYATADRVKVTYRRGVPVSIYIDQDRRIADEEYGLGVEVTG